MVCMVSSRSISKSPTRTKELKARLKTTGEAFSIRSIRDNLLSDRSSCDAKSDFVLEAEALLVTLGLLEPKEGRFRDLREGLGLKDWTLPRRLKDPMPKDLEGDAAPEGNR